MTTRLARVTSAPRLSLSDHYKKRARKNSLAWVLICVILFLIGVIRTSSVVSNKKLQVRIGTDSEEKNNLFILTDCKV